MTMNEAVRAIESNGGYAKVRWTDDVPRNLFTNSTFMKDVVKNMGAPFIIKGRGSDRALTMIFDKRDGWASDWYGGIIEKHLQYIELIKGLDVELLI
jgi:hypothetical protein